MAKNRTVSPSTQGVRPAMKKLFDGRNMATRPIPIISDVSEQRAIAAAAADQRPKTKAIQFPTNKRPISSEAVFGSKVGAPGNTVSNRAATFNPATGTDNFH